MLLLHIVLHVVLQVIAEDSLDVIGSGSFQSTATITVNLININDEYPQFVNAPYSVILSEHSKINSLVVMVICIIELSNVLVEIVLQLNITDRDIGPGGMVNVTIVSNEDIFELVNNEILVKNSTLLDYEANAQYVINVEATDMGTPAL